MFILLPPMWIGIFAGMFGLRQMMRVVIHQRTICKLYTEKEQITMGAGEKKKWRKALAVGAAAGIAMDVIAYAVAGPLARIGLRRGSLAGVHAFMNGDGTLRVALSLWGHGSLLAGAAAFVVLAAGTAVAVCSVIVTRAEREWREFP